MIEEFVNLPCCANSWHVTQIVRIEDQCHNVIIISQFKQLNLIDAYRPNSLPSQIHGSIRLESGRPGQEHFNSTL